MTQPTVHFSYGQFVVAYLDARGVTAAPGAACGLLGVQVRMSTHAAGTPKERKRVRIPLIVGTVSAEGVGHLASTQALCADIHGVSDNPPRDIEITAAVPFAALQEVDRLRSGGSVKLIWNLQAQVAGDSQNLTQDITKTSAARLEYVVDADRWNALMTLFGYEERVYVDSHVAVGGPSYPERFADAGKHFKVAVQRHRSGDWEGTAVSCRNVLDELIKLVGSKRPPAADFCSTALSMDQRVDYLGYATRHMTHIGAHGSAGSVGQGEARLVLEATASLLRFHLDALP